MKIRNWNRFQTLRKDRENAPWRKVFVSTLTDWQFKALGEVYQARFLKLLLVADPATGELSNNLTELTWLIGCPDGSEPLDMERLSHFITGCNKAFWQPDGNQVSTTCLPDGNQVSTRWQPSVYPEVEVEVEVEESRDREELDTVKKQTVEESAAKPRKVFDYTAHFADFWNAYPKHRRQEKPKASEAYRKKVKSVKLATRVLDALEVFKQSKEWLKSEGRYVQKPENWINGKRWDEVQDSQLNEINSDKLIQSNLKGAVL